MAEGREQNQETKQRNRDWGRLLLGVNDKKFREAEDFLGINQKKICCDAE